MRENIFLALIIISVLGCGAQNNPIKETQREDNSASSSIMSSISLPKKIYIPFPIDINSSENSPFNRDIQQVKKTIALLRLKLKKLEKEFSNIIDFCKEKSICHINKTLQLEAIDFIQDHNNATYQYKLMVESNQTTHITFSWSKDNSDIISSYIEKNSILSLRYLTNFQKKETMLIHNKQTKKESSYIVQSNDKKYHLSYNLIQNGLENFSSNIKFEDDLILEYNENIFELNIATKNLKEGSYLLLPPKTKVKSLSFIEIVELAQGTFSFFDGEVQGFLYDDKFINNIDELILFHLN